METITIKQRIQVAKDRALDELRDLIDGNNYLSLSDIEKGMVRHIARLISLPDDSQTTLKEMKSYINNEEELFYKIN